MPLATKRKSFLSGRYHRDLLSHVVISDTGVEPERGGDLNRHINHIPAGCPSALMKEALGLPPTRAMIGRGESVKYWESQLTKGALLSEMDKHAVRPSTAENVAKHFKSQMDPSFIAQDQPKPKEKVIKYHNSSHLVPSTLIASEESSIKTRGKQVAPKVLTKIFFGDEPVERKGKRMYPEKEVVHFDGFGIHPRFPSNEVFKFNGVTYNRDHGKRHIRHVSEESEPAQTRPNFRLQRPIDNSTLLHWPGESA